MELKLETPAAEHREPSISSSVATCLKWGALYGIVVMLIGLDLADLGIPDAAFYIGVPAGVVAALVMARRLDQARLNTTPASNL